MLFSNPFEDPKIAVRYAHWYQSSGEKAARQEKHLLQSFLHEVKGAKTLLDIGCGTGYFTNWFHDLGLQAFGLDRSPAMLQQVQRHKTAGLCLGDATRLPFASNSFDLLSFITVLEFLPNPWIALSEGLRVARRGLLLGVINRHSLLGLKYRVKDGPIWNAANFFTSGELIAKLKQTTGFHHKIFCKTTLWPLFSGYSKLPWGGFIGLAVIFTCK